MSSYNLSLFLVFLSFFNFLNNSFLSTKDFSISVNISLDIKFNWYASRAYVVDDKWAELAKQFIDDPTKVEFHRGTLGWEKTKCASAELLRSGSFSQYRLTPVYEWQWLYQVNGQYYLTQYWYKDKKEVMNQIMDAIDSLELFEPSKRLMR